MDLRIALINGGVGCVESWQEQGKYSPEACQQAIEVLTALGNGAKYSISDKRPENSTDPLPESSSIWHELINFFGAGEYKHEGAEKLMRAVTSNDHYFILEQDMPYTEQVSALPKHDAPAPEPTYSVPVLVGFEVQPDGSTGKLIWTDANPPPTRNYDPHYSEVGETDRLLRTDLGQSVVNVLFKDVSNLPTDGRVYDLHLEYWDFGDLDNIKSANSVSYTSPTVATASKKSTAGMTAIPLPASNISYGNFSVANLMPSLPDWYMDGAQNVAVETRGGERVLVARMIPATSGGAGSNQIKSAARLPSIVTGRTPVEMSFEMKLRAGFSFGVDNSKQTAKLGFGFRSTVDSSGGFPKTTGFSVRPNHRGNGDGTANIRDYMYTATTSGFGDDDAPYDTGVQLVTEHWYQIFQRMILNDPGQSNGVLQCWIDNELVINVSNINFISSGTPNIAGFSFTNFFGGDSPAWRPANTSYAEFKNQFYKIG